MDLDDFNVSSQAPPRKSRFAPKSRAKKQLAVVVKEENQTMDDVENGGGDVEVNVEVSMSNATTSKIEAMEEEDDHVVDEYDVYFTPSNLDCQLYVMQYPLRPSWRPYELEHRCTEVRLKPTSVELEVDLSIEVESDYYDRDSSIAEKRERQTLSSSGRPPQAAGYAVGLLKGKRLHLNPIHAVLQLRPSVEYLDYNEPKKKIAKIAVKEEGSANNALVGPSRKQNKQTDPEVVESWIPLNYHNPNSDFAQTHLRKMATEEGHPLQFSVKPYDYLNSLCPGAVINKMKSSGLSRRSLLSLPLEERLKTLLVKGPHVQRFTAIKHLAPDDPVGDVLQIVQQHANLVQGVWVAKSRDRCTKEFEMKARDYALFLFSQNPIMKDSELDILGHKKSVAKTLIREIAAERPSCKDWKFKEPTDVSFMKLYPHIVEHQRNILQDCGKQILQELTARRSGPKRPVPYVRHSEGMGRSTNEACSINTSMSKETREALSKVLEKLFLNKKVCSLKTICQGLRDTAVSISALSNTGARPTANPTAVKSFVDVPQEELQVIISEFAVNVHGVYLLKSSSEHSELNPLRTDVIDLFYGKEQGAKLKKGEIMEAAKNKPTTSEFQKVISEYCVFRGGAWVLKSGEVSSNDWQSIFKAVKLI